MSWESSADSGTAIGNASRPPRELRQRISVESIELLRGLWTEGEFSYMGEHYKIEKSYLVPKPLQHFHRKLRSGSNKRAIPRKLARLSQFGVCGGGKSL